MGKAMAFTGHRPESLPFGENEMDARCIRLKAMLLDEIMHRAADGYDTFYCGAALGMDIIFGRQVLLVKLTSYPAIKLICVVPHVGHARAWSEKWQDRYENLLEQADEQVFIAKAYTRDCYHRRNRYMVDHADMVLSIYNGSESGGTAYTTKYAHQRGKEIVVIDPDTLERSVIPARTIE